MVVPGIILLIGGVMRTSVDSKGVHISCGALRLFKYDFSFSSIDSAYSRKFAPMQEFGGWGIKSGLGGHSLTMAGDSGVQLVLNDLPTEDKRYLLGSQHPQELERAIQVGLRR